MIAGQGTVAREILQQLAAAEAAVKAMPDRLKAGEAAAAKGKEAFVAAQVAAKAVTDDGSLRLAVDDAPMELNLRPLGDDRYLAILGSRRNRRLIVEAKVLPIALIVLVLVFGAVVAAFVPIVLAFDADAAGQGAAQRHSA